MLNVIIFGAPGSGKGLQSKKLAADPTFKKSSGLIHISTGDLLREEMNKHSIRYFPGIKITNKKMQKRKCQHGYSMYLHLKMTETQLA